MRASLCGHFPSNTLTWGLINVRYRAPVLTMANFSHVGNISSLLSGFPTNGHPMFCVINFVINPHMGIARPASLRVPGRSEAEALADGCRRPGRKEAWFCSQQLQEQLSLPQPQTRGWGWGWADFHTFLSVLSQSCSWLKYSTAITMDPWPSLHLLVALLTDLIMIAGEPKDFELRQSMKCIFLS